MLAKKRWESESEIIKLRTGLETRDYYKQLIAFIHDDVPKAKIFDGLGQLLVDGQQRRWVKENLLQELVAEIQLRL
jgi:hypothetical protein